MGRTKLSNAKYEISCAEGHIKTADKEYARYKNKEITDSTGHWLKSQKRYALALKAVNIAVKLIKEIKMDGKNEDASSEVLESLQSRADVVIKKCSKKKGK